VVSVNLMNYGNDGRFNTMLFLFLNANSTSINKTVKYNMGRGALSRI
jgi:hypothetical protein